MSLTRAENVVSQVKYILSCEYVCVCVFVFASKNNKKLIVDLLQIIAPKTVEHHSGKIVHLWSPYNKKQLFFVTKCKSSRPIIALSSGVGRCKTVPVLHKALFLHNALRTETVTFDGCRQIKLKNRPRSHSVTYLCDDWVKLPSYCSLFVSHNQTNAEN